MIGEIIFQRENYREIVILVIRDVRLILCMDGETFKLYRLEAPSEPSLHNNAYYSSKDALDVFNYAIA